MNTENKKAIERKNDGGNDKTEEIIRCVDDIILHIQKGDNMETAMTKAIGSYGYTIASAAQDALIRNAEKFSSK